MLMPLAKKSLKIALPLTLMDYAQAAFKALQLKAAHVFKKCVTDLSALHTTQTRHNASHVLRDHTWSRVVVTKSTVTVHHGSRAQESAQDVTRDTS